MDWIFVRRFNILKWSRSYSEIWFTIPKNSIWTVALDHCQKEHFQFLWPASVECLASCFVHDTKSLTLYYETHSVTMDSVNITICKNIKKYSLNDTIYKWIQRKQVELSGTTWLFGVIQYSYHNKILNILLLLKT